MCLFLAPKIVFGQLYEISLDEKIENASLIVEGEVVESESFRAADGNIYTSSKIKVGIIFKGDFPDEFATVTTRGGMVDGEIQTWSHMLTLKKGDYGIFMLAPCQEPSILHESPNTFEAYSDIQGFLAFQQNEAKAWVAHDPFHMYSDIPSELYAYLESKTNQKPHRKGNSKSVIRTGVRYHFTDIGFDGTSVTFNVYVNSLIGTKRLFKSGIQFGYNPAFWGADIATNGNLQMQDAGISLSSTYDLEQSNVNSSKVKIELTTVGSPSGLVEIGATEQLLAKGKIKVQNFLADPGINYDIDEMQSLNRFWSNGQSILFDTVVVEGDFSPTFACDPIIDSIRPANRSAGTRNIVVIFGKCFGVKQLPNYRVQFYSALSGPAGWVEPLETDYQQWTDSMIQVRVPSVGYWNFGNDVSDENYAGTGKIRVKKGAVESNSKDLFVRFCARNFAAQSTVTNLWYSIRDKLRNKNGEGGYDLYFTTDFLNISGSEQAFRRALTEWRCATKVNFRIKKLADIPTNLQPFACAIRAGALPPGCASTVKACTALELTNGCATANDFYHVL